MEVSDYWPLICLSFRRIQITGDIPFYLLSLFCPVHCMLDVGKGLGDSMIWIFGPTIVIFTLSVISVYLDRKDKREADQWFKDRYGPFDQ